MQIASSSITPATGDGAAAPTLTDAELAQLAAKRRQERHARLAEEQRLEAALPFYTYKEPVVYYQQDTGGSKKAPSFCYSADIEEANDLLACLGTGPLGFDMEWDPAFRRGQAENPTALIQICSSSLIVLLHLTRMKSIPSGLTKILTDPHIIKCGVAILSDAKKFNRDL